MAVRNIYDNGLNVQYVADFIEKEAADNYLIQLKTLPFYTPTFKIRGKSAKSKRLVLAYGDENLSYNFSGSSIIAEAWTPLMLELRDHVEKFAACSFNYVLLNHYANGTCYISQHKDDESGLDASFPIVVLSFGAERTIEFKKPHTPSTFLKLAHGSLYSMQNPTNKLFTHGIAPEPLVKDARISLTFRHLVSSPVPRPIKKARLQERSSVPSNMCEKDCSSTNNCENDISPSPDLCVQEKDISSTNACGQKDISTTCDEHPVIAEWDLNWRTFLQIVLDSNCNIRLHIRVFKETKNGDLLPTRKGVMMTPSTWLSFICKISNFKFQSVNDSFVCNNQLIVLSVDSDFCLIQQIFPLNTLGFFLKPSGLKLYSDQVVKLNELLFEITESIINAKFKNQLPKLIFNSPEICFTHISVENAKQNFSQCLSSELNECISNINNNCESCLNFPENQEMHTCVKTAFQNYVMNRHEILLCLNLNSLVKNLLICCSCHYTSDFFNELNLDELIEELLP